MELLVSVPQLKLRVNPMLGETVACAAVSPHLYILSYKQVQCYPPLRKLHSDFSNRKRSNMYWVIVSSSSFFCQQYPQSSL